MKNKQQVQAKNFFEKDALNWSKKSKFKNTKIYNTIHERNLYVINLISKFKLKSHLDIGCGIGDLAFETSKKTNYSIGMDFSENMIKIAKSKFRRKNLQFLNKSFFEFKNEKLFDCISANGFIEYLSLNEIINFFKKSKSYLNNNGIITFSSRNRIFNLFSLNEFSKGELNSNSFKDLYEEAIFLNNANSLNEFISFQKKKITMINFKQPSTGIKVSLRHQFSPLQLTTTLLKFGYKILDLHPINYHPVVPKEYNKYKNYRLLSNYIFKKSVNDDLTKLSYIPFSSSFMVTAKKVR